MLVNLEITSDSKVLFSQACGKSIITQQCSHFENLSGNKHMAVNVCLKDWPDRQSLVRESSASSSSVSSKFSTFVTSVQSICVCEITTSKINNPQVRNFLLKY
jgi:hypothetical protein